MLATRKTVNFRLSVPRDFQVLEHADSAQVKSTNHKILWKYQDKCDSLEENELFYVEYFSAFFLSIGVEEKEIWGRN